MGLTFNLRRLLAASLAVMIFPALLQTGTVASPQTVRLSIAGSTTMAPLLAEVGRRFQHQHPGYAIEVRMGGSGRGISAARDGSAQIGMVSRALNDGEQDLYGIPIARDGVAVIVHRDNPVSALTQAQLTAIYTGNIGNWRQLGGRNAPLHVLAGPPEGGSSEQFTHFVKTPYPRLAIQRQVGPNAERIRAAAGDPNAIIYVSVGEAERMAKAGHPIKLLAIDGVAATSANVRNGNYPMSRPLTLVSRATPDGVVRQFLEYCITSQITDLILAFDFVPYLD